jgi:hypothetical protein
LADVYEALAISASDKIKESYEFYKKIQENKFKNI